MYGSFLEIVFRESHVKVFFAGLTLIVLKYPLCRTTSRPKMCLACAVMIWTATADVNPLTMGSGMKVVMMPKPNLPRIIYEIKPTKSLLDLLLSLMLKPNLPRAI